MVDRDKYDPLVTKSDVDPLAKTRNRIKYRDEIRRMQNRQIDILSEYDELQDAIKKLVNEGLTVEEFNKDILNIEQLSEMFNLKISYIYKMIHLKKLPHYKPFGKLVYFKLSEIVSIFENSKEHTKL